MTETPRSALRLLREGHEERVLRLLRVHGALSRSDLARESGLSRTALWSIITRLVEIGAVVESDAADAPRERRGKGRPPTYLTLNPASGYAIGIDLGHRRIHVTIANAAHDVVAATSEECEESATWQQRVEQSIELVRGLVERQELSLTALEGVGVGVIGPVAESGSVPPTRHDDVASHVHDLVSQRLDAPVYVDNNTRLGAVAEAIWGGGRDGQDVLYVRLSYGVGGGLVLDGHLFSGAFGAAGEFGHISVDPDGPECHCGGRGCLERYVAIPELLKQASVNDLGELLTLVRAGNTRATAIVREAGTRLGRVLAAASNVVNPEVVVIGGEVAAAGERLLEPAREAVAAYAHRQAREGLQIVPATLGDDAAALGGVALVLRRSALLAGYPVRRPDQIPSTAHPTSTRADRSSSITDGGSRIATT